MGALFTTASSKLLVDDKWLGFPRVELHLHLDGSIRLSTLLQLAEQKSIRLKGAKTVEELRAIICSHRPSTLAQVLAAFDVFLPCVIGDAEAIERIAYELCEDQANNNVIYFEARYSPHLLSNTSEHKSIQNRNVYSAKGSLAPAQVIEAVNRGLKRGEEEFKVKARTILCCIESYEHYFDDILNLADQFKSQGVVAIDVAGCTSGSGERYDKEVINIFQEAARRGIGRTVHAGESGGANTVICAIDEMKATRIGHGYRVMEDPVAYAKYALPQSPDAVHFEACPYSSVMTGAVKPVWIEHPILKWSKDGVNFSISTDDTTCFENTMTTELRLCANEIGVSIEQLKICQLNAAKAAFLPADEKAKLVNTIEMAIGVKSPH